MQAVLGVCMLTIEQVNIWPESESGENCTTLAYTQISGMLRRHVSGARKSCLMRFWNFSKKIRSDLDSDKMIASA